jgi:Fe-S cluster assembly protein SufD
VVDLRRGRCAQHIASFDARLGEGAELDHLAIARGAALSRLQGFIAIEGEGGRFSAAGANMLGGSTHGDVALVIDHAAGGATSRVLYRNVAEGEAFGAFQGRIIVRPGAQKTDGRMMTNTLVPSDSAEFAAKPELEIYADDVQCGHGATTGQIDEAMMFYLLSRGIPRKESEALLLRAFLVAALEPLPDRKLAEALEPIIAAWLRGRQA